METLIYMPTSATEAASYYFRCFYLMIWKIAPPLLTLAVVILGVGAGIYLLKAVATWAKG